MSNYNVTINISETLPNMLLGTVHFPLKLFRAGYQNFDPISFKETDNSEDCKMLFDPVLEQEKLDEMEAFVEEQIKAQSLLDNMPVKEGHEELIKELKTLVQSSFEDTLRRGCGVRSLEVHFMDIYLREAPKISMDDGLVKIIDVNLRLAYHITVHGKCGPFRKHVDFKFQDAEVQTTLSVKLKRSGSVIKAYIEFDRLKLVLRKVFKFTFDIKKYLKPKVDPIEVFDLKTFSASMPNAEKSLIIKKADTFIEKDQLKLGIEFATK